MASFSSRTDWAFLALLAVIVCAPFQRVDPLLVLPGPEPHQPANPGRNSTRGMASRPLDKGKLVRDLRAAGAVRWNAHSIFSGLRCSGGAAPGNRGLGFETKRCCSTQFWQWFFSLFWVQAIFGLRLRAPDDRLWYRAEYGVPSELGRELAREI